MKIEQRNFAVFYLSRPRGSGKEHKKSENKAKTMVKIGDECFMLVY